MSLWWAVALPVVPVVVLLWRRSFRAAVDNSPWSLDGFDFAMLIVGTTLVCLCHGPWLILCDRLGPRGVDWDNVARKLGGDGPEQKRERRERELREREERVRELERELGIE